MRTTVSGVSRRILVLNIPASGHIFPTLAVVAELVGRGNRVIYPAVGDFAELVAEAGAEVVPYRSVDPVAVVAGKNSDRAPVLFLEESLAVLDAAAEYLGGDAPDLVAYDTVVRPAGRVLAKRWAKPAVELYPVFASNEHYSFAAKMMEASGLMPGAPGASGVAGVAAGPPPAVVEFGEKVARLLAANGISTPVGEFMAQPEELSIVFLPREFQPAGDTFDERFSFVGPCLSERRFLGEWQPPEGASRLVLISAGTVNNKDAGFFKAAVGAVADLPWHAVIGIGNGIDPDQLGPLPENVTVRKWVPYLRVLEHAELAVTNAGMGGIMEALSWGRPLIVVPSFPDAMPNADRLVELGLGQAIRPADLSADRLRAAILAVAADEGMRHRAQRMRAHIRDAGGAVRAAAEIEKLL